MTLELEWVTALDSVRGHKVRELATADGQVRGRVVKTLYSTVFVAYVYEGPPMRLASSKSHETMADAEAWVVSVLRTDPPNQGGTPVLMRQEERIAA